MSEKKEMPESKQPSRLDAIREEIREHKGSYYVFLVLRALIVLAIIRHAFKGDFESVFSCCIALVLLFVPSVFQARFKVSIPVGLEITILCFIYAAIILGEINAFYIAIPFWDTMLHTLNGFLCAAVGLSLVSLLNDNQSIAVSLSPFYLAVTAFCFSMTIGALWEFAECFADLYLGTDAQKDWIVSSFQSVKLDPTGTNIAVPVADITDVILVFGDGSQQALGLGGYLDIGILDTMKDLFVNFIGAVVFSTIGYVQAKRRQRSGFASLFVPSKKTE